MLYPSKPLLEWDVHRRCTFIRHADTKERRFYFSTSVAKQEVLGRGEKPSKKKKKKVHQLGKGSDLITLKIALLCL